MSMTFHDEVTQRLHRSELTVPASNSAFIEKARFAPADVICLDLEDSVAPEDKSRARANVIAALNDLDWGTKTLNVRVNGLDTEYTYRDVIEITEACPRLDMLFLPKIGVPADVYAIDTLVTQVEMAKRRKKRIGFEVMIETALGLCNIEAIAQSSSRLEAMCFGSGDFAASTGARLVDIGVLNPDYGILGAAAEGGARPYFLADPWHAVQARIVAAARAYGLRPIDGPFSDFRDTEGSAVSSKRAAAIGFEGRMVIHPSQISSANEIFSPTEREIAYAQSIKQALGQAAREGRGAVTLNGRMVDRANIRMAERVLQKVNAIAQNNGTSQLMRIST